MIRIDASKQNLAILEADIAKALDAANRQREELRVVVVTKTHQADIVGELLELGVSDIGESYVQEAVEKMAWLRQAKHDLKKTQWHMIGHVQSRKTREIVTHFDWLHSLDSLKLARRLDKAAKEIGKKLKVLLQVNISGEASKFGLAAKTSEDRDALLETMEEILRLGNLDVVGLMSIPPFEEDKSVARDLYKQTRKLRDFIEAQIAEVSLAELSMGMSNDFAEAILEGASIVRVGTAVLGPRVN